MAADPPTGPSPRRGLTPELQARLAELAGRNAGVVTSADVIRGAFLNLTCPECRRVVGQHVPGEIHRCIAATYGKAALGSPVCPGCSRPGPHDVFVCMDLYYVRATLGTLLSEQVDQLWRS